MLERNKNDPVFFQSLQQFVDKFFIYDNGSTDGSLQKLQGDERVRVTRWDVTGDSFVEEARVLTDSFWKQSRGSAEWVFVVDMDEHLSPGSPGSSEALHKQWRDGGQNRRI